MISIIEEGEYGNQESAREDDKVPSWYDKDKLVRIRFAPDETGWAVDMGDGTYRLANQPIAAMCENPDYKEAAHWGDLVRPGPILYDSDGDAYSCLEVIERYAPEE